MITSRLISKIELFSNRLDIGSDKNLDPRITRALRHQLSGSFLIQVLSIITK